MESGHSFLPNYNDFGKREKARNKNYNMFTANEWKDIIKQCNFYVIEMKGKFVDFYIFKNVIHTANQTRNSCGLN